MSKVWYKISKVDIKRLTVSLLNWAQLCPLCIHSSDLHQGPRVANFKFIPTIISNARLFSFSAPIELFIESLISAKFRHWYFLFNCCRFGKRRFRNWVLGRRWLHCACRPLCLRISKTKIIIISSIKSGRNILCYLHSRPVFFLNSEKREFQTFANYSASDVHYFFYMATFKTYTRQTHIQF